MTRIRPPLVRPCPPPPKEAAIDADSWCIVMTGKPVPRPRPVDDFEDAGALATKMTIDVSS